MRQFERSEQEAQSTDEASPWSWTSQASRVSVRDGSGEA